MPLELMKERYNMQKPVFANYNSIVTENDINVPDVKPDISSIVYTNARAYVNNCEITDGAVKLSGIVEFMVVYSGDDNERSARNLTYNTPFGITFENRDIKTGMYCSHSCNVEHAASVIQNSRKITLKAVIQTGINVSEAYEAVILTAAGGIDGLELKRGGTLLYTMQLPYENKDSVKGTFTIPQGKPSITEILAYDIRNSGTDFHFVSGKLSVSNNFIVSMIYRADDIEGAAEFIEYELPYVSMQDLPEFSEKDQINGNIDINEALFELTEDNDGEMRVINSEIRFRSKLSGYCKSEQDYIEDAYGRYKNFEVEKKVYACENLLMHSQVQISVKENIILVSAPEGQAEMLGLLVNPGIAECLIQNGMLSINGLAEVSLFYKLTGRAELFCDRINIPVRHEMSLSEWTENMEVKGKIALAHSSYSLPAYNEVELRVYFDADVYVFATKKMEYTDNMLEVMSEDASLKKRSSITLYFPFENQTIWEVCKKFRISQSDLEKYNQIDEKGTLPKGKAIMIASAKRNK